MVVGRGGSVDGLPKFSFIKTTKSEQNFTSIATTASTMSGKKPSKDKKRPILMVRTGPNDGTSIRCLKQELAVAKEALKAKQDNAGWEECLRIKTEIGEAQKKSKRHSEAVDKLLSTRTELDRKIEAAEAKKAKSKRACVRKENELTELGVNAMVLEDLRAAEEKVTLAEKALVEGKIRNKQKCPKSHIKGVIQGMEKSEPERLFDIEKMVPAMADELVAWYKEMDYEIDSPKKRVPTDAEGKFLRNQAVALFDYWVGRSGFSRFVVLDCYKSEILSIIHKLEGYTVHGMAPGGRSYSRQPLTRPEWENREDKKGMLRCCADAPPLTGSAATQR